MLACYPAPPLTHTTHMKQDRLGYFIDPVVIAGLKRIYPNTVPSINATDREIWAAVGRQEVIAYLERELASIGEPLDQDEREDF